MVTQILNFNCFPARKLVKIMRDAFDEWFNMPISCYSIWIVYSHGYNSKSPSKMRRFNPVASESRSDAAYHTHFIIIDATNFK